jgi:hypothetical protein
LVNIIFVSVLVGKFGSGFLVNGSLSSLFKEAKNDAPDNAVNQSGDNITSHVRFVPDVTVERFSGS